MPSAAAPSIILFMVDQLSAKWLEAARVGIAPTPNFDRLRARGVSFSRVITSNPVCMPTRATIATGLNTRGHGVIENGYRLDPQLPTFMRALQARGYRTGAFGKVHLEPHFAGVYPDYKPFGFDVAHITEDARGGEWLDWVERQHPEHFDSVLATIWPSMIPDFAAYGPDRVDMRQRIHQARADFQWATPEFPGNCASWYTLPFPEEVSQTGWITAHALDFLRQTDPGQPLFAQISYVQPHSPFCAPAQCLDRVDADRIPEPLSAEWASDPQAPAFLRAQEPSIPPDWRYARQLYFADIVHLDDQLGQVLAVLEETGRLANSHVVFLSDHGEMFFDHGLRGKEEKHYDACIRVPLMVSGPGLEAGLESDHFVQLEDICPTILELAGAAPAPMPTLGPYLRLEPDDIPVLPGRSLLPLCRGQTPPDWRQEAYSESFDNIGSYDPTRWVRTVRTESHRYSLYLNGGGEQLFDLRQDPDEQHNLAADPAAADVRQALRDRLLELVAMQDYPKTRRELFALGVH